MKPVSYMVFGYGTAAICSPCDSDWILMCSKDSGAWSVATEVSRDLSRDNLQSGLRTGHTKTCTPHPPTHSHTHTHTHTHALLPLHSRWQDPCRHPSNKGPLNNAEDRPVHLDRGECERHQTHRSHSRPQGRQPGQEKHALLRTLDPIIFSVC